MKLKGKVKRKEVWNNQLKETEDGEEVGGMFGGERPLEENCDGHILRDEETVTTGRGRNIDSRTRT